jgi:hypothetical protein
MSDLVQRLLDRAYSGKATDALCEEAAKEIERLNVAITSYAASSKAAAREINELKTALARLADSPSATDSLRGDNEVLRLRLQSAHAEMELLCTAIRRLADQDATLSVCNGNVTVTIDATLTDEEREAMKLAAEWFAAVPLGDTLRGLLERLK